MPTPMPSPPPVRVVSTRTVTPPPRPSTRIPLTPWDMSLLSSHYIQKGLLFARPVTPPLSAEQIVDHLAAALADVLVHYYPVAGRFATDEHRDEHGEVVGISISIDCDGQGVELINAVAGGVGIADVIPPDADVPHIVQSFFPLNDAINYDGHKLPLFVVQVTELTDGFFLGCAYNHALSDGTSYWDFLNAWAEIARARLASPDAPRPPLAVRAPIHERWSADGGAPSPVKLPYSDLSEFLERLSPPPLRERMIHFSAASLAALKARAREELAAAGDEAGATAVTSFQALSSLMWRSITRARRMAPHQETLCRIAINNRGRLRPPLPREYFGNSIYAICSEAVKVSDLLARGHGFAAASVGRAVAAHTDEEIRQRVAAWVASPILYTLRSFDGSSVMMGSSPRFDMYGCDFGWGKAVAARSGKANKFDGKASLYPGWEGGGSIDAEVVLAPEHMEALEADEEFWASASPSPRPAQQAEALPLTSA